MKVATYRVTGMFAGRIVEHRQVQGDLLWRIKVKVERESGQIDIREVLPAQRVPISALHDLVIGAIREVCAPGERLTDASLDFYVEGGR